MKEGLLIKSMNQNKMWWCIAWTQLKEHVEKVKNTKNGWDRQRETTRQDKGIANSKYLITYRYQIHQCRHEYHRSLYCWGSSWHYMSHHCWREQACSHWVVERQVQQTSTPQKSSFHNPETNCHWPDCYCYGTHIVVIYYNSRFLMLMTARQTHICKVLSTLVKDNINYY